MKKIFAILILFLLASVCYAAEPSAYSTGIEIWDYDIDDTLTAGGDTVTASGDSSVLYEDFNPERGWHYRLARNAISGTGSDSVALAIYLRPEDWNETPICTVAVDSFTAAAGEYIEIPFGTYPARQYDIVAAGYSGIGTQVIINRCMLFRVRPILTAGKNEE